MVGKALYPPHPPGPHFLITDKIKNPGKIHLKYTVILSIIKKSPFINNKFFPIHWKRYILGEFVNN